MAGGDNLKPSAAFNDGKDADAVDDHANDDDGVGDDDGGDDDYGGDDDDDGVGVNYGAEGVILHGGCIVLSLCTLGAMMGMITIVLKTMMIKIALMMITIVKI